MKHLTLSAIAVLCLAGALNSQTDSTAAATTTSSSPATEPAKNTSATEKVKPFQFSFFTPVGTNGLESFKTINKVSLNVLVGVSRGVDGFEAGGIANVVLKDVKGVQFAGFGNVALGDVEGGQFAGYVNFNGGNLKGAAFAGFANVNLGELHGGQFSSAFNLNKKGGKGIQISGHTNLCLGDLNGVQIAGFANVATKRVEGAQISGFMNYGKKVKGLQLGIINIADSVDGASIGFLNLIRKGMHQIELSGDEVFYTNLAYRTGTRAFHNIFSLGFQPGSKEGLWQIGYGAGSSFKIKDKWHADLSATAHHVNTKGFTWGTSEMIRLYCGVEYKLADKFSIAAGPTFNIYVSDELLLDYAANQKDIVPYHSFNHSTDENFNVKGWVGGRIALRFL